MGSKRMIVTLSEEDTLWLKNYSKAYNVSVAEAIRQGVGRQKKERAEKTYAKLVQNTRGVWKRGDGLKYQENIRSEWHAR